MFSAIDLAYLGNSQAPSSARPRQVRAEVPQSPRRIGIADLEERLATNRTTIWRWYTAGTFPMPHYIGTRRCWWVHDIEAWEAAQADQRAPARAGFHHSVARST